MNKETFSKSYNLPREPLPEDVSSFTSREDVDWVVVDARKFLASIRTNSLVQGGAVFTKDAAIEMAKNLNEMVYKNAFFECAGPFDPKTFTGPFCAYGVTTAKFLGLL